MFLPDFQPIREAIRVFCFCSAYAVSGPSVLIIMFIKSVRTYVGIHTYADFTGFFPGVYDVLQLFRPVLTQSET